MQSETPDPAYGQVWTYLVQVDGNPMFTATLMMLYPIDDQSWQVIRIDGLLGDDGHLRYISKAPTFPMTGLPSGQPPIKGYTYIEG